MYYTYKGQKVTKFKIYANNFVLCDKAVQLFHNHATSIKFHPYIDVPETYTEDHDIVLNVMTAATFVTLVDHNFAMWPWSHKLYAWFVCVPWH